MKHIARIFLIGLAALFVVMFTPAANLRVNFGLRGNWIVEDDYDGSILFNEFPSSVSFSRKGEGTIDGMSMTWKTEEDKVIIAGFWGTTDYYYYISGKKLVLSSSPYNPLRHGTIMTYTKR